MNMLGIHQR